MVAQCRDQANREQRSGGAQPCTAPLNWEPKSWSQLPLRSKEDTGTRGLREGGRERWRDSGRKGEMVGGEMDGEREEK